MILQQSAALVVADGELQPFRKSQSFNLLLLSRMLPPAAAALDHDTRETSNNHWLVGSSSHLSDFTDKSIFVLLLPLNSE